MFLSSRAQRVRAAALFFLGLIPLLCLAAVFSLLAFWGWGVAEIDGPAGADRLIVLAEQGPVAGRGIYGLLASLPALAFGLVAAWHLLALFAGFRFGGLVGPQAIRRLRGFAGFTALAVMAAFVFSGVMRWALGVFDDAPLWTHLGFSAVHAAILLMAGVVYMASEIVEEGYTYKREAEDYV